MGGFNFTVQTPDATNVNQNSKAIIDIPCTVSHTYLKTFLIFRKADGSVLTQAEMLANIGDFVVKIDGKKIIDADFEFMVYLAKKRNGSDGINLPNGLLEIMYQRPDLATDVARELTGWGMKNVKKFTMELEIKGTAVKQIEAFHRVSPMETLFGTHITVEKSTEDVTGTGKKIYTDMPIDNTANENLLELVVRENGGTITDTACKVGNVWIKEWSPVFLDRYIDETTRKVEQAGYYTFSFNNNRSPLGLLPLNGVRVFHQHIEWSAKPTTSQADFFLVKVQNLATQSA